MFINEYKKRKKQELATPLRGIEAKSMPNMSISQKMAKNHPRRVYFSPKIAPKNLAFLEFEKVFFCHSLGF